MKKIRYQFGVYKDTIEGKEWVSVTSPRYFETDAEAESFARHKCSTPLGCLGIWMKRGGAEWFVQTA